MFIDLLNVVLYTFALPYRLRELSQLLQKANFLICQKVCLEDLHLVILNERAQVKV